MISFLPLKDKMILEKLNNQTGTTSSLAYCMYERNKRLGFILYDITEKKGIVQAVSAPDDASFDGLVRSMLASLLDIDIHTAEFSSLVDQQTIEHLGFVKKGGNVLSPIEDILYRCENCRK